MLDMLLVLGQIPGTSFQITFYEFSIFWLLVFGWYFRRQLRRLAAAQAKNFIAYLKLKLWQRRQLSLPV